MKGNEDKKVKNVLYVDKNPVYRKIIELYFTDNLKLHIELSDGKSVSEKNEKYDLIILGNFEKEYYNNIKQRNPQADIIVLGDRKVKDEAEELGLPFYDRDTEKLRDLLDKIATEYKLKKIA